MMRFILLPILFCIFIIVYIFNFLVPFLYLLTHSQIVKESEKDMMTVFFLSKF